MPDHTKPHRAADGVDDGEALGGVKLAYAIHTDRRLVDGRGRMLGVVRGVYGVG